MKRNSYKTLHTSWHSDACFVGNTPFPISGQQNSASGYSESFYEPNDDFMKQCTFDRGDIAFKAYNNRESSNQDVQKCTKQEKLVSQPTISECIDVLTQVRFPSEYSAPNVEQQNDIERLCKTDTRTGIYTTRTYNLPRTD